MSRESFGGGYYTFFYGTHLAEGSVNDLNFHLTNLIEMGFFVKGILAHSLSADVYIRNMFVDKPREGFICEQEVTEMVANDPRYDPQIVADFNLNTLFQVFVILKIGIVISATRCSHGKCFVPKQGKIVTAITGN